MSFRPPIAFEAIPVHVAAVRHEIDPDPRCDGLCCAVTRTACVDLALEHCQVPSYSARKGMAVTAEGSTSSPDWSRIRAIVLARDGYCCRECGSSEDARDLDIHHLVPRASGGDDAPS